MKVLLTSTSFQDAPGKHQELLKSQNFIIETMRGPLTATQLKPVIGMFDAVICGDDEYTSEVLEIAKSGNLKYISKYGVGLDKIDLVKAKELGIHVTNCPGVNQVSVAEHVFALLLSFVKNIHLEYNITRAGGWKRHVSKEIYGKTIGIVGLGAIGKEVAKRANGFGLNVIAFDKYIDNEFIKQHDYIKVTRSFKELAEASEIITLHIPYTMETDSLINLDLVKNNLKKGCILINTSRGKLVNLDALNYALDNELIGGYLTDVLDIEPMPENYPLKDRENVLITPHIGSRTYESVERQGLFAVRNLLDLLNISYE